MPFSVTRSEGVFYPSAEMESVYSTATVDWTVIVKANFYAMTKVIWSFPMKEKSFKRSFSNSSCF